MKRGTDPFFDDSKRLQQKWIKIKDSATDRLANISMRGALLPIADIVAVVYDCRPSGLSSGFGCKN
jgi:hypothetical protein